jgi:hypothetical protein
MPPATPTCPQHAPSMPRPLRTITSSPTAGSRAAFPCLILPTLTRRNAIYAAHSVSACTGPQHTCPARGLPTVGRDPRGGQLRSSWALGTASCTASESHLFALGSGSGTNANQAMVCSLWLSGKERLPESISAGRGVILRLPPLDGKCLFAVRQCQSKMPP